MRHLCILFVYKNVEHVKQCFESLYIDDIDFWVVENHSENAEKIQQYFRSTGRIKKYFYFEENITCNATRQIIKDYRQFLEEYDFVTVTDCDLLVDNAKETFKEITKNASFEEVAFSCVDLKMENFPSDIPGSHGWLPPAIDKTEEYIECPTGGHLMTIRKGMLDFMLSVPHMTDSMMFHNALSKNKKWVKTINNKAYHLTWDLYTPDNPYFQEKNSMTHNSWYHDRMCKYTELELVNHTKQSLELVQTISEQICNLTFHHHFHVLYDIPLPENATYLEIGCYGGASSSLMLQKPGIKVITIDLGTPIDDSIAKSNISKLNKLNNEFHYVKADSQLQSTVDYVKGIAKEIDLLFIDGDHSHDGVINDFNLWSPLVKSGGYIVFDDYNDISYSPEVMGAVDSILENLQGYDIIGALQNFYRARPSEMLDGNCLIVRKK